MGQEIGHQNEHGDRHHAVILHLVVNFCHGDGHAGVAQSNGAHNHACAAQNEGQFLTQYQTDHHQTEEQGNQDDLYIAVARQGDHKIL